MIYNVRQIVSMRSGLKLCTARPFWHASSPNLHVITGVNVSAHQITKNQPLTNLCKQHVNLGFANVYSKQFSTSSIKCTSENNQDDLQRILKDKTLGLTAKFKILFRQYGIVLMSVYISTTICWVAVFYYAVKNFDVMNYLENIGVFKFLEKIGFSYAEKLKESNASDWLMTYLLYEIAKPIRYVVTLFGTVYSVRYLRKMGYFKPPPKAATVGELVQRQSKIIQHRFRNTTTKYRQKYGNRNRKNPRNKRKNSNDNQNSNKRSTNK